MKPPIYEPAGKAKEYGDLAINIYTGCNHGCFYCFAPNVLHKTRETFGVNVEPRRGIVDEVKKQLSTGTIKDKQIHLCFTCDPYPADIDTTATREIIRVIKDSGNRVQILTKGGDRALRDFDLLDSRDWFGITFAGGGRIKNEPNAAPISERFSSLLKAKRQGLNTWVSFEPVLDASDIYAQIQSVDYCDLFKIGKLNYRPSDINWGEFGRECERLCKQYGRNYYIKESLREAMGVTP